MAGPYPEASRRDRPGHPGPRHPWQLAGAWPGSELVLIDDAGHALTDTLIGAIDRFAARGIKHS